MEPFAEPGNQLPYVVNVMKYASAICGEGVAFEGGLINRT